MWKYYDSEFSHFCVFCRPRPESPCPKMKIRCGEVASPALTHDRRAKEDSPQVAHQMDMEGRVMMDTNCEDELCSSPEGFPPLPQAAPSLPSCQLSPRSDSSSFLPFPSFCQSNLLHSSLPTPPASDPEPEPRPSSSLSPSYFSMSPPDLLSPPLSTTSHHSDSCSSPASSLPLPSSHPTFTCSCSASEEPQYMQQSFAKQPSNEQSNQSNQGGDEYGTIIGVKSEPGCRCVNLTFNQMTKLNSSSCEVEEVAKEGKTTSHASPLPSDIPTLESLAQSSPKLSTWRQTRIISEKLEQVGNWDLSFSCKCVLSSSLSLFSD